MKQFQPDIVNTPLHIGSCLKISNSAPTLYRFLKADSPLCWAIKFESGHSCADFSGIICGTIIHYYEII